MTEARTEVQEVWEPYARSGPARPRLEAMPASGVDLLVAGNAGVSELSEGVTEVTVVPEGSEVGPVRLEWRLPCVDATAFWTPYGNGAGGWLPASWSAPQRIDLSRGAPIAALVGTGDTGLCCFAADRTDVEAGGGVVEETGEFRFWLRADGPLTVRIDTSRRHFGTCLRELTCWWEELLPDEVIVPDAARRPAYSTWYSMHQELSPQRLEEQAALAGPLGMEVLIVDDGWMTADRTRGYGHCGAWDPVSLPDTAAHVEAVHRLGLAYMLWYALPFVGRQSPVWDRFQPYVLDRLDHLDAIVVDPRYPDVRAYLTGRVACAVEEWGMDGLKLDFVDRFHVPDAPAPGPQADCATVDEGVSALLAEIRRRITAATPGAMIETRQPYVSPGLWPYTTMIRAVDCPLSPGENRQHTIDTRLVSGPLAVHSDMLMWHPAEPPEQVACHLINVLFAVPQISVDLRTLTEGQRDALAFWLRVMREHHEVLQLGTLRPARPDLGYPLVRADLGTVAAVARYAALPVAVDGDWRRLLIANADADPVVVLTAGTGTGAARVADASGRTVWQGAIALSGECGESIKVSVPRGGLLTLDR
ncbi:glycoside hydrolase family 36 protein [Streptomyces sp. NBC_00448]|uniref:glycoside hydrolase family 36 protein n=1 Tax=Streptomyces sp. NBC_00448 TaxID=2903652 RepID=UPI002E2303B8